MADFLLRPALETDFPEIKMLIRQVRINPTGLDWRHFTIAVHESDLIACGQLKQVPGGEVELASLAVRPEYRLQGVARALIERLLERASRPVYLTCLSRLGPMYEKFGFRVVQSDEMPVYYRCMAWIAGKYLCLTRRKASLLVMKLG